jgi:hypothetical protein
MLRAAEVVVRCRCLSTCIFVTDEFVTGMALTGTKGSAGAGAWATVGSLSGLRRECRTAPN